MKLSSLILALPEPGTTKTLLSGNRASTMMPNQMKLFPEGANRSRRKHCFACHWRLIHIQMMSKSLKNIPTLVGTPGINEFLLNWTDNKVYSSKISADIFDERDDNDDDLSLTNYHVRILNESETNVTLSFCYYMASKC